MQLLAPQIEEAISEPRLLGIGLVAEHRQRQIARRSQDFDLAHVNLDEAGRHLGVLGARRALAHVAVDAHDEFRAQLFRLRKSRRIRIDHALREPVMIAQIDEQQSAVVADAMAPAGEPDGGAVFGEAERAAGVGAIAMHDGLSFSLERRLAGAVTENAPRGKREVLTRRGMERRFILSPDKDVPIEFGASAITLKLAAASVPLRRAVSGPRPASLASSLTNVAALPCADPAALNSWLAFETAVYRSIAEPPY